MAEPLGFSAGQLQQLIREAQKQQLGFPAGQQQQGEEPAAAKRPRLAAAPHAELLSLLDAAAACLPTLAPPASLSRLPTDPPTSGPLLQPEDSASIRTGQGALPAPVAAAEAQDQKQQQAEALLLLPVLPATNASGPDLLLAAMQQQQQGAALPAQLMQHHVQVGASGHSMPSGDGTEDSTEADGSAGGQAGDRSNASKSHARQLAAPATGRRNSEDKATANKEKNRRAQQRFRLRQKEKLAWLESELERLRALLTAHGIDPSLAAPSLGSLQTAADAASSPAAAAAAAAVLAAAAAAAPLTMPQGAGLLHAASTGLTTEQMYDEVEHILEGCATAIPSSVAIAYLTAWQRSDSDTKRCQYRSLKKRSDSGRIAEIATCVNLWLSAALPAQLPPQQAQQAVSQQAQQEVQKMAAPMQQVQHAQQAQQAPLLLAAVPTKQE